MPSTEELLFGLPKQSSRQCNSALHEPLFRPKLKKLSNNSDNLKLTKLQHSIKPTSYSKKLNGGRSIYTLIWMNFSPINWICHCYIRKWIADMRYLIISQFQVAYIQCRKSYASKIMSDVDNRAFPNPSNSWE